MLGVEEVEVLDPLEELEESEPEEADVLAAGEVEVDVPRLSLR